MPFSVLIGNDAGQVVVPDRSRFIDDTVVNGTFRGIAHGREGLLSHLRQKTVINDDMSTGDFIRHRCFSRVGLLGNPSDGYHGKVVSFALQNFSAEVRSVQWQRYSRKQTTVHAITKALISQGKVLYCNSRCQVAQLLV